jgi:hypothetical protein
MVADWGVEGFVPYFDGESGTRGLAGTGWAGGGRRARWVGLLATTSMGEDGGVGECITGGRGCGIVVRCRVQRVIGGIEGLREGTRVGGNAKRHLAGLMVLKLICRRNECLLASAMRAEACLLSKKKEMSEGAGVELIHRSILYRPASLDQWE